MEKTKYQQAGTDHAKEYLDKLLEIEDYVGGKIGSVVEQRVKRYAKGSAPGNKT